MMIPRRNGLLIMKDIVQSFFELFLRFRYPVSMPRDVATDLGLEISNFVTFQEFTEKLIDPHYRPTKLSRWMPRNEAEKAFHCALKKECFSQNSLFSYYFNGSWMEFILHFDDESRLRRLYVRHRDIKENHEICISP
jgi:hypothetical protein